jgi:hypothetical protein
MAEICLGLVVACLPALNVLFIQIIPSTWQYSHERVTNSKIYRVMVQKSDSRHRVTPFTPITSIGLTCGAGFKTGLYNDLEMGSASLDSTAKPSNTYQLSDMRSEIRP